jgi:hypothetical protein
MKGKDVLLAQLDYMRYELGLEHIYCPEAEELVRYFGISDGWRKAFSYYYAMYFRENRGKSSFGDDPLCGEMNRWTIFFTPIAGLIEAKLEHRVGLDVIVQPGCASPTVVAITASNRKGKEILVFKQRFAPRHIFKKETLLSALEYYYKTIYTKAKPLAGEETTRDEI